MKLLVEDLTNHLTSIRTRIHELTPQQREALQAELSNLLQVLEKPGPDEAGPASHWQKAAQEEAAGAADTPRPLTAIQILDELPLLIWRAGLDAKCNYFNKSWLAFTGRTLEQELGDGWVQGIHPDDLERVMQTYHQAFQARQPFELEYRLCHHTQEYRWILDIGRPIRDNRGVFAGYVSTCFDLTDRKQMEKALRSSESMFKAMFEYAPDGVIAVDRDSKIVLFNQQAQKIFGYSPEEILNKPLETLIPLNFREKHSRHVNNYQRAPRVRPMGATRELYGKRKDGSLFPVDITLGPLETEPGQIVLSTVRDITDRRRTETELRLYREHLEELVEARTAELQKEIALREHAEVSLQAYAAQLARSNRDLEEFASIVSHDLQEPLRKILAFGERLKTKYEQTLGEEGQDYLERMFNASTRMQNLLNSLLTYSRVSTKAQPPQPVDLNEVIADVVSDLEVRLEETAGKIEVSQLPTLEADPLQMRQLFQNLIGNALKFHQPDLPPRVRIWSDSLEHNRVRICVEDNGIGFEEKYIPRIFQPFQRLHGRGEYEGSGMGLAICQKIVERHKGKISVTSHPNQGTKFMIEMPRRAS